MLRLDGGFTFSRDNSRGDVGSVLRFEFSGDEAVTILESSMPPCYQDADVIQHTPNEARDVDGKRYVELETRRDTTTYLFILSESQPKCSGCATAKPVCQGLFGLFAKKQFKPESQSGSNSSILKVRLFGLFDLVV